MDWVALSGRITAFIKKYRFVLLVLLIGLVLMSLPSGKAEETEVSTPQAVKETRDPESDLEEILSQIEGAGKVSVLLTQAAGEETIYQTDDDTSTGMDSSSVRRETVIITGADKAQQGLVSQVNPPVYMGAVIVCQGADRATVRLAIVEAVANATGLSADKITVLKMK